MQYRLPAREALPYSRANPAIFWDVRSHLPAAKPRAGCIPSKIMFILAREGRGVNKND